MRSNSIRLSHLKEVIQKLESLLGVDGAVTVEVTDRNNILFQDIYPSSSTYCFAYSRILEDRCKEE